MPPLRCSHGNLVVPVFALFGHVDDEWAAGHFLAIELADGFLAGGFVGHGDKAEAAGATATGAGHDEGVFHLADRAEDLAEILRGGVKRKVTYVESNGHGGG